MGSGKSWHAAAMLVLRCLKDPGIRVVCAREIQKTLAESAKRLIEDRMASLGVGHMFRVQHDRIINPGDGLISFWGLADKNAESIKSLEAVKVCWIEEAQMLTKRSLDLLRPTIRAEGSEIREVGACRAQPRILGWLRKNDCRMIVFLPEKQVVAG